MFLLSYTAVLALWAATIVHSLSIPKEFNSFSEDAILDLNSTYGTFRRQNQGVEWLRIMPLGASITQGTGSTPEDGYRKPLRDHLRSLGYKVNMVGSRYVSLN